jgi:hypothetical protein
LQCVDKFHFNRRITLQNIYVLEELIDAGTHGQVFEGTDTVTLKSIAVKIVPEAKLKRMNFVKEVNTIK